MIRKQPARRHSTEGVTLVEVLVSLLIGALIAGILLDMFSKLLRVSSATQNEICANVIAQETMDAARSLDYKFLASKSGTTYDLLTHKTDSGQPGVVVRAEPVLLDLINKNWNQKVVSSKFTGTVTFKIENADGFPLATDGTPDGIKVSSIVSWSDSERQASGTNPYGRTITTSMILTRAGLNRWMR